MPKHRQRRYDGQVSRFHDIDDRIPDAVCCALAPVRAAFIYHFLCLDRARYICRNHTKLCHLVQRKTKKQSLAATLEDIYRNRLLVGVAPVIPDSPRVGNCGFDLTLL
jgi:hypothetical protein